MHLNDKCTLAILTVVSEIPAGSVLPLRTLFELQSEYGHFELGVHISELGMMDYVIKRATPPNSQYTFDILGLTEKGIKHLAFLKKIHNVD